MFLQRQVLNLTHINRPKERRPWISVVFLHLFCNILTLKSVQHSALNQQRNLLGCNGQKKVFFVKLLKTIKRKVFSDLVSTHNCLKDLCRWPEGSGEIAELGVHTDGRGMICNQRMEQNSLPRAHSTAPYWKKSLNFHSVSTTDLQRLFYYL